MTTSDMILRVRQGVREIDSFYRGSLLQEEILLQLNIAQNQYQYSVYQERETNLKSIIDIRTTEKIENIIAQPTKTSGILNSKEFLFPPDFNFLNEVSYAVFNNYLKPIDIISRVAAENYIQTPENIPIVRTPKMTIENNRMVVIYDPFESLQSLKLPYFRKLVDMSMSVNCELPTHTHDKVCEFAILTIIGRRSPEQYQIAADINNQKS